jgi:hypothetical protein
MALFRLTTSSSAWARSGSDAQSAQDASSVTRTLVLANRCNLSVDIATQNVLLHRRAKLDSTIKADKEIGKDDPRQSWVTNGCADNTSGTSGVPQRPTHFGQRASRQRCIVSKKVDGACQSGRCRVWIKVNPASIAVQLERSEKWHR